MIVDHFNGISRHSFRARAAILGPSFFRARHRVLQRPDSCQRLVDSRFAQCPFGNTIDEVVNNGHWIVNIKQEIDAGR